MAPLDIQGAILCASLAFGAVFYYARSRRKRSTLPLPPGPRKLSLVGNLLDIPTDLAWEKYMEWSKEYNSDTIHLNLAGQSVIVLSSLEATEALLEKRSALYSDRSDLPMVNGLMGWDFNVEIIMSMAYGIDVLPSDDPYVVLANKGVHSLVVALVNRYLVDMFPASKYVPKWFPGAEFQRKAEEWRKLAWAMVDVPYAETKRQMECGIAPRSFTSDALHTLHEGHQSQCRDHVSAGADTTVSALSTFFLAILANPEAQRKAQTEIDAVIGGKYLPDFDDEAAMPYVSALVKEVLRWKNVTPIRVPHFLATEDEYRGYRLPAGSIVIGSTWAILYDELMYPDPYAFKPERFLLDGKPNPAVKDPDCAAFRFGRRPAGYVIEPTFEYLTALVSAPLPFKCSITPRSNEAAKLIRGIMR
ncbi:cytochrome P450 [Mycena rebaudengoi]|nr:cytochrome P450 [Mycena rebaudengoi]